MHLDGKYCVQNLLKVFVLFAIEFPAHGTIHCLTRKNYRLQKKPIESNKIAVKTTVSNIFFSFTLNYFNNISRIIIRYSNDVSIQLSYCH